ncbi:MBL fold metallo-hydrolase [Algiphilus sp.]|uniref:MBL fold metallo-hydrolase n=1 Tax=Algiphilus sp. TaxID=1872431 RepID=UPI0032EE84CB
MWKKGVVIVAVLLAVLVGLFLHFEDRIVRRVVFQQALATIQAESLERMGEGLHVVLCGSGSPLPDPTRAGPCALVIAGEQVLMVDVGSGSMRNLGPMGIPPGRVDALLLTHFHSDHIDGIGELMLQRWAGGSHTAPLPVIAPEGVTPIVEGFNQAYRTDIGYRIAHHGEAVVPPSGAGARARPFALPPAEGRVVLQQDGLTVTAFPVDHAPVEPSVGYRFDYQGRSALISGDTKASEVVRRHAQGVDLLVHEALASDLVAILTEAAEAAGEAELATITRDILDYHTSPVEAARIAAQAEVGHLLYTHIVPQLPVALLERQFLNGVDAVFDGPVTVGEDGLWVSLPAKSTAIRVEQLLRW